MDYSFISFEQHGKPATKRLQRQHVIRRQMTKKKALIDSQYSSTNQLAGRKMGARYDPDNLEEYLIRFARVLESQTVRQLLVPDEFKSSEKLISIMWNHPSRRVEERLILGVDHPLVGLPTLPVSERRRLISPQSVSELHFSMDQGLDFHYSSNYVAAAACFERAFQAIGDVLRSDHFALMSEIGYLIVHAYALNCRAIAEMLLRQLKAMATQLFGASHTYAIWSQAFLEALDSDQFLKIAVKSAHAFADGIETALGMEDIYTLKTRMKAYTIEVVARGADPGLGDVSEVFESQRKALSIITKENLGDSWIFILSNELTDLCEQMMDFDLYESAMSLLVGVEDLFDQAVALERKTKDDTAVQSAMGTLYAYVRVLVACRQFEKAESLVLKCMDVATEVFGSNCLYIVKGFTLLEKIYEAQGLWGKVKSIKARSKDKLAPYVLG